MFGCSPGIRYNPISSVVLCCRWKPRHNLSDLWPVLSPWLARACLLEEFNSAARDTAFHPAALPLLCPGKRTGTVSCDVQSFSGRFIAWSLTDREKYLQITSSLSALPKTSPFIMIPWRSLIAVVLNDHFDLESICTYNDSNTKCFLQHSAKSFYWRWISVEKFTSNYTGHVVSFLSSYLKQFRFSFSKKVLSYIVIFFWRKFLGKYFFLYSPLKKNVTKWKE